MALMWENSAMNGMSSEDGLSRRDASAESLLDFWHAIEMVHAPELLASQMSEAVQGEIDSYTWNQHQHPSAGEKPKDPFATHSVVYCGCFGSREAIEVPGGALNGDPETNNLPRKTFALFRVTVSLDAGYEAGSFRLSTAPYAIERLLWPSRVGTPFEQIEQTLGAHADSLLACPLEELGPRLGELSQYAAGLLGVEAMFAGKPFRHRCIAVDGRNGGLSDMPLNSVFIGDIQNVREWLRRGGQSAALNGYLQREALFGRLNIESEEGIALAVKALIPSNGSPASWPSDDRLSTSERLAINLIYRELHEKEGIQSVSLPVGASPHRLIREIVADALVSRADILASYPRSGFAFSNRDASLQAKGDGHAWKLAGEMRDHSVVVTSTDTALLASLSELLTLPRLGDQECDLTDQILRTGFFLSNPSCPEWMRHFYAGNVGGDVGLSKALIDSSALQLVDEARNTTWRKAINDYDEAKYRVLALRDATSPAAIHCHGINRLRTRLRALERGMQVAARALAERADELTNLQEAERAAMDARLAEQAGIADARPSRTTKLGVGWLFRRIRKAESGALPSFTSEVERLRITIERARASLAMEEAGLKSVEREISVLEQEWRIELEKVLPYIERHKASYLDAWLTGGDPYSTEIELREPWEDAGLAKAQEELFHQALRLHAVFIRLESRKLKHNLKIALRLTRGADAGGLDEEALASVWESLFLVSPVMQVSTHAMSQALKTVGPNRIGWMIMCEGGKATPQAALGAVYRAKRYVSIGERCDLRDRWTAPAILYRLVDGGSGAGAVLDPRWRDRDLSAQSLADESSPYGYVRHTDLGDEWCGIPVRSVEVGNEPMLSILRRVVSGTHLVARHNAGGEVDEFDSGWIDIRGTVKGGWAEAEMQAAGRLLEILTERGVSAGDIAVTSPFVRVRLELEKRFAKSGYRVLAPDELRGGQSSYVVLMLGAAERRGREAVTQGRGIITAVAGGARRGLFVIGDHQGWSKCPTMRAIAELLPKASVDVKRTG